MDRWARRGAGALLAALLVPPSTGTPGSAAPAGVPGTAAVPAAPPAPPAPPAVDLRLPAHPSAADLARVRGIVDGLARQAERLGDRVRTAAGEALLVREQLEDARTGLAAAQQRLDAAARDAYEQGGGDRVVQWLAAVGPGARAGDALLLARARTARVGVDVAALDGRREAAARVAGLQQQADAAERALLAQAAPVEQAQARARQALAQAEAAFAADQQAEQALEAERARLDAASAAVALAVTPAVTASGRAAQAAQAPLLAELARLAATAPGALPAGYRGTGRALAGVSSWYGPGFVGRPTSSGSPYDPEQLTCAMLAVPLGTLVRVTGPTGRSAVLLVTDHGPYVAGRLIDVSAAAARLLGIGLSPVTVEPLVAG